MGGLFIYLYWKVHTHTPSPEMFLLSELDFWIGETDQFLFNHYLRQPSLLNAGFNLTYYYVFVLTWANEWFGLILVIPSQSQLSILSSLSSWVKPQQGHNQTWEVISSSGRDERIGFQQEEKRVGFGFASKNNLDKLFNVHFPCWKH